MVNERQYVSDPIVRMLSDLVDIIHDSICGSSDIHLVITVRIRVIRGKIIGVLLILSRNLIVEGLNQVLHEPFTC